MNRMLPDKKIKDRTKNTLKTKCLIEHRWKRTGKRQRQEVKKQQNSTMKTITKIKHKKHSQIYRGRNKQGSTGDTKETILPNETFDKNC